MGLFLFNCFFDSYNMYYISFFKVVFINQIRNFSRQILFLKTATKNRK